MSTSVKQENTNVENLGNVKILQDPTSVCVTPVSKDQSVYKVKNALAFANKLTTRYIVSLKHFVFHV